MNTLKAMVNLMELSDDVVADFSVMIISFVQPDGSQGHAVLVGGNPSPTQVAGLMGAVSHTLFHKLTETPDAS